MQLCVHFLILLCSYCCTSRRLYLSHPLIQQVLTGRDYIPCGKEGSTHFLSIYGKDYQDYIDPFPIGWPVNFLKSILECC